MTVVSRSYTRLRIATHSGGVVHGLRCVHRSAQTARAPEEFARGQERPHPQGTPRHSPAGWHVLWFGPGDGAERVSLSPQEFQKLQEQIDQLKKQLAARRTTAPSGCAIRGRVEKRGEQLVAVLKLTLSFRTTAQNARFAGWEEGVPGFRVARWRQAADPRDGGRRFRRGHRNAR